MIICIQIRFRTGATTTVALHQISRWNGLDLGDTIAPWFSPPRRFLQLQQMMAMLDTSHYPFRSLEKKPRPKMCVSFKWYPCELVLRRNMLKARMSVMVKTTGLLIYPDIFRSLRVSCIDVPLNHLKQYLKSILLVV